MFFLSLTNTRVKLKWEYRQKTPKVVFHVKASSAFDRLEDHCKREHRDVCKYLMAMTDGQLSEMNGRLNVRTKNV